MLSYIIVLAFLAVCIYIDPDLWPVSLMFFALFGFCEIDLRQALRQRQRRADFDELFERQRHKPAPDASQRGRDLLNRLLTPEQRQEYETTGKITAVIYKDKPIMLGSGWGIRHGRRNYCVSAGGNDLVKSDRLIAQLLMARTDPKRLINIANRI